METLPLGRASLLGAFVRLDAQRPPPRGEAGRAGLVASGAGPLAGGAGLLVVGAGLLVVLAGLGLPGQGRVLGSGEQERAVLRAPPEPLPGHPLVDPLPRHEP